MSTTTDFKSIDSKSEYLFRTCSVATSLVTSLIQFLLCCAVVNHSSSKHKLLPLLVATELFRKPLVTTRTSEE